MTTRTTSGGKQVLAPLFFFCAAALLLVFCAGCNSSTDPGGDPPLLINFEPTAQGQQISLASTRLFSVVAPDAKTIAVNWWRNNNIISNALTYTYVPTVLGADTLRVQVSADGVNRAYFWVITVTSTGSSLPPPVPSVGAGPGPEPSQVSVTWNRAAASTYPIAEYAITGSYDGPITLANWDQAMPLGRVTNRVGQVGYEAVFTAEEDGMIPGAEIWVAVRAVDNAGQMSPIAANGFTTITTGWWLNGVVLDDLDRPVVGATIEPDIPQVASTNSDVDGLFRLGPFRNIDLVSLTTGSSNAPISGWYDFRTPALDSTSGHDYTVRLITRHLLDPNCSLYGGQFLDYIRFMTLSVEDPTNPENSKLWKWDSYPISVAIPDTVTPLGVDFGQAARDAMAEWNAVMGETYFVETSDFAGAGAVFLFADLGPLLAGKVSLLEPHENNPSLGEVIPEKVQVYLWSRIGSQQGAYDTALHELGHALGLISHVGCTESGYLMVAGGGDGVIHIDEQRAVQCIRRLAQGTDMAKYSLSR